MKKLKVKLVGEVPLLQHNVVLANPMSEQSKALKVAQNKGGRKKDDSNYEEIAEAEFFGGLIMDGDEYIVPPEQIEAMICAASYGQVKISKSEAVASIFVDKPFVLTKFKGPKDPKKRFGDANCMDQRCVCVTKNRVVRTRPMFIDWVAEGEVVYDNPFTEEKIKQVIESCQRKGIGDFRPRFGRFTAVFE